MIPKTRADAEIAIRACARIQGDRFDLTACAIACSVHEDPDRDMGEALQVLEQLTAHAHRDPPRSHSALAGLLFGEMGFSGATGDYDDPANCDLISILTSRAGLPIGLGHIWRHVARVGEVPLYGTDTPGHFIMRLETEDAPIFIDPFEGGAILVEDDLKELAKRAGLARLSDRMLRPISDRVMAVRLQTNLVARARAKGDVEAWMRSAHRRVILAPDNYQIAMDFAEAAEAAGHIKTAVFWAQHATSLTDAPAAHGRTQSLTHKLN